MAHFDEDDKPRQTPDILPLPPSRLESASVEELRGYIARLQAEIERIEKAIAAKTDHRSSAERFFKS